MKYYIVDAFTEKLFRGNPAGVCLPDEWPDDAVMQSIAAENNLAETAFVIKKDAGYGLRWFTPEVEIDLCGHATLASAYVLANFVDNSADTFAFSTLSGVLTVDRKGDLYEMDFPSRKPEPIPVSPLMEAVTGTKILEAHRSRDLLLLLESEEAVKQIKPDLERMKTLPDYFGVIATAKGETADFVSRFFAPGAGIPEDPVTGSSHSTLIPFWAERLGKNELVARQLSKRGGVLYCNNGKDRVTISGHAALYLAGEIRIT